MSEENNVNPDPETVDTNATTEESSPPPAEEPSGAASVFNEDEIIEIEWEQVEDLFHNKQALNQTEEYLSGLLLDYEKKKKALLSRIEALESMMYEKASALRDELSVSPQLTYELKLPQNEGDKSYFIRKDPQE